MVFSNLCCNEYGIKGKNKGRGKGRQIAKECKWETTTFTKK